MAKRTLGPGTLSIGESGTKKEWAGSVSKITLSTDVNEEDPVPLLDGSQLDGEASESQTLKVTVYQDYEYTGLTVHSHQHAGSLLPFTFEPVESGGIKITGTLKMRRMDIGGDVKKKNTSEIEFPIIGLAQIAQQD